MHNAYIEIIMIIDITISLVNELTSDRSKECVDTSTHVEINYYDIIILYAL